MRFTRKIPLTATLALVLLITLVAGLKPKGYRFRNDVAWAGAKWWNKNWPHRRSIFARFVTMDESKFH